MSDWDDWWPLILVIVVTSVQAATAVFLLVANLYIYLLIERPDKKGVNVLSKVGPTTTVATAASQALGGDVSKESDSYSIITESTIFTQYGFGQPISDIGLVAELKLNVAKSVLTLYHAVTGEWPVDETQLLEAEDIKALTTEHENDVHRKALLNAIIDSRQSRLSQFRAAR